MNLYPLQLLLVPSSVWVPPSHFISVKLPPTETAEEKWTSGIGKGIVAGGWWLVPGLWSDARFLWNAVQRGSLLLLWLLFCKAKHKLAFIKEQVTSLNV